MELEPRKTFTNSSIDKYHKDTHQDGVRKLLAHVPTKFLKHGKNYTEKLDNTIQSLDTDFYCHNRIKIVGGEPVGFIHFTDDSFTWKYYIIPKYFLFTISLFVVDPKYRNRGYGRELLQSVIGFLTSRTIKLRKEGAKNPAITLQCNVPDNDKHTLYINIGFTKTSSTSNTYTMTIG